MKEKNIRIVNSKLGLNFDQLPKAAYSQRKWKSALKKKQHKARRQIDREEESL